MIYMFLKIKMSKCSKMIHYKFCQKLMVSIINLSFIFVILYSFSSSSDASEEAIISRYWEINSKCRGAPPNENDTWCLEREKIAKNLKSLGYCLRSISSWVGDDKWEKCNHQSQNTTSGMIESESKLNQSSYCSGVYSDVYRGEDYSGLELKIKSERDIIATYYEGSVSTIRARDIVINGKNISFKIWNNLFQGVCDGKKIKYKYTGLCSGCVASFGNLKLIKKLIPPLGIEKKKEEPKDLPLEEINNSNPVSTSKEDLPYTIQKDDADSMLKEANKHGFKNYNDYQEFLEKQNRLTESGIILKSK